MPEGQVPHATAAPADQHTLFVLLIMNHQDRPLSRLIRTDWTPASAKKNVRGNVQHALQAVSPLWQKNRAAPGCAGVIERSLNRRRAVGRSRVVR